jgi:hypothetical protein
MENSNKDLVKEQDVIFGDKFESMDIQILETKDKFQIIRI